MGGCGCGEINVICQNCGVFNEQDGEWGCPYCALVDGQGEPLTCEQILAMRDEDRFSMYVYLGLNPVEKSGGGRFLYWRVGSSQFNENKPRSKATIIRAIEARKQVRLPFSVSEPHHTHTGEPNPTSAEPPLNRAEPSPC